MVFDVICAMQSMSAILAGIYTNALTNTVFQQSASISRTTTALKPSATLTVTFPSSRIKCNGKLDCLIYEMLFIKKKKPILNTQSDSIRANYLFRHTYHAHTLNYTPNMLLIVYFFNTSPCRY